MALQFRLERKHHTITRPRQRLDLTRFGDWRDGCRPLLNGSGGKDPLASSAKNSETWTASVLERRSRTFDGRVFLPPLKTADIGAVDSCIKGDAVPQRGLASPEFAANSMAPTRVPSCSQSGRVASHAFLLSPVSSAMK